MIAGNKVKKLPDVPGVYFFTRGREILYIGKATSLRDRVRSYFSATANGQLEASRGNRIVQMLALVTNVRCQKTGSVLEALLLESELIKKHQPKYNAREKDDKSYWYVVITKEEYPRVLMIRGQNLKASPYNLKAIYGPFPNSAELREALRLIRKIFPYRDRCTPNAGKLCFNAQIGLCPGLCMSADSISRSAYRRQIIHLKILLSGRVRTLIAKLTSEMRAASRRQDFEQSAQLRDQIRALEHIQDVGLIKDTNPMSRSNLDMNDMNFRIESYDIAHLAGTSAVGVMTVAEDGEFKPSDYRKFKVAHGADDLANLREVLMRRFRHAEWLRPNLIVIDGGPAQLKTAQQVLSENKITIPIVSVIKDDCHRPKDLLGDRQMIVNHRALILHLNHEAHRFAVSYHRQKLRHRV